MSELEYAVRDGDLADKNFIYSTWLKGQYYGCEFFKTVPYDLFYGTYPSLIDSLLNTPGTTVKVACDAKEPAIIWAYVVISHEGALHWAFTKQAFRGKGLIKTLLPTGILSYSGKTAAGDAIAKKFKLIFKPLVLNQILTKGKLNV